MPWLAQPHAVAEEARYLAEIAFPPAQMWVADEHGAPAGFLACEGEWIMQLYLAPEQRRRGLGTTLLAAAGADHPPVLKLYAFQRNAAARAFYERHGFRCIGLGDGSGNMEGKPDALYGCRAPSAKENQS
jgi:ribosomal protein S18 acetylase RimI-like enzyme